MKNVNLNTNGSFMSVDEMVTDILTNRMDDESIGYIKALKKSELISLHHSLGQWIRNSYGLWDVSNPHVDASDPGDPHPDSISMKVIELLHQSITSSNTLSIPTKLIK